MEHPLALSIANDSATYQQRCRRCFTSTPEQYRAYLHTLCCEKSREECIKFGTRRHSKSDLDKATDELAEGMRLSMEEWAEMYKSGKASNKPPGML